MHAAFYTKENYHSLRTYHKNLIEDKKVYHSILTQKDLFFQDSISFQMTICFPF